MKDIIKLGVNLKKCSDDLIEKLMVKQNETAKAIWEDVVLKAPSSSGEYISSIKVGKTKFEKNIISTKIYTDMKSEDGYFIGRMIENGTGIYALEPHIGHTKTFIESGYRYWYVPAKSVKRAIGQKININGTDFYIAYAQPSKPHFKPSLEENKELYRKNISKALKEVFK